MTTTRELFLITGIPGTGKTTYGTELAQRFGFVHYDIEDGPTGERLSAAPAIFIDDLLRQGRNTVVTWGFVPDDPISVSITLEFKNSGFKLLWFDGNRPAALWEFIKRGTVPEILFYLQMYRIEASKIIDTIKPLVIDPFDALGNFKSTDILLQEIRHQ